MNEQNKKDAEYLRELAADVMTPKDDEKKLLEIADRLDPELKYPTNGELVEYRYKTDKYIISGYARANGIHYQKLETEEEAADDPWEDIEIVRIVDDPKQIKITIPGVEDWESSAASIEITAIECYPNGDPISIFYTKTITREELEAK